MAPIPPSASYSYHGVPPTWNLICILSLPPSPLSPSPSLSPPFLSLPPSHPLPPFLLLPSLPLFLYRLILWVFSSQVLRELMILSPLLFTRVLRAPRMLAVVLVAVLFTPR